MLGILIAILIVVAVIIKWILSLRRVVPTNMVHIVQKSKATISYGKGQDAGNVYYEWPSFLPLIGITKRELPVSNFDLDLHDYEAYDKDRLPFVLDVKAFFRISNTNEAANKVASFSELVSHLEGIVQGAVRSIMANAKLEEIMSERSVYGKKFTDEVQDQLKEWGVIPVKNIELMDIRDTKASNVIGNIMAKKKSEIEKESRVEVAKNMKEAQTAEIAAKREIELREQDALESVGKRKAEVEKNVGIMTEKTRQDINEEAKLTKDKEMEIIKVAEVRKAEIDKQASIIKAEQDKTVIELNADAQLEAKKRDAEMIKVIATADLEAKKKEAEGIQAEGTARADAKTKDQLASVTAQTTLAKEIGENRQYQEYLVAVEQVKANKEVGIEQAKNLGNADIKVIANGGDVNGGLASARELFTPKGGTNLGGMLEALVQTDTGKKLFDKFADSGKDSKKG